MSELSRFYGIVISILFTDNKKHHKSHVHVKYAEYEASVALDGEVLAGSMPSKQLKLIQAWLTIHEEELHEAWNNAVRNNPVDKIKPLQ